MKKLNMLLAGAVVALAAFTTLSCQGIIFATIREEIALEDAQITGVINSVVRFAMNTEVTETSTDLEGNETQTTVTEEHEFLFCQNGDIWKKDVNAAANGNPNTTGPYGGQWVEVAKPDSNIIKLAADSNYLYALAAPTYADTDDSGENIESGRTLYYTSDGVEWTAVAFDGSTELSSSTTPLFCTNAPQKAHRHAYIRIDTVVYELNGATPTALTTGSDSPATAPTTASKSATVLGGDVYFSTGFAMASNETFDADATAIYYGNGDDLYYSLDGSTWTSVGDPGDTIYSMACTSDYLLLGTDDGLIHVALNPGTVTKNTEYDLSSYGVTNASLVTAGLLTLEVSVTDINDVERTVVRIIPAENVVFDGDVATVTIGDTQEEYTVSEYGLTVENQLAGELEIKTEEGTETIVIALLDDSGEPIIAASVSENVAIVPVTVTVDGVPSGSTSDFTTNADSTLSSYYQVRTILAADPALSETAGDIYGSTAFSGTSASFSNVCLWAYYPGRGKWNCE